MVTPSGAKALFLALSLVVIPDSAVGPNLLHRSPLKPSQPNPSIFKISKYKDFVNRIGKALTKK